MLPDKIMQSDLLDILFENRNKMYGAYALRKSYNRTLASAITGTLFIALVFSIFQFIYHEKQTGFVTVVDIIPDPVFTKIDDPKPLPKVQPAQHVAATHASTIISSTPVIVSDDKKTDMPTVEDALKNVIGSEKFTGAGGVDVIQAPVTANASPGSSAVQPEIIKVDEVLKTAAIMPQYPGGIEALKKFMLKNLRQPGDLQEGEKIIVMATFVVNKNGEIENVKIVNDGRDDLNKEVMRVINKMPLWKPGMQNGKTVAVYFNLPVTFITGE